MLKTKKIILNILVAFLLSILSLNIIKIAYWVKDTRHTKRIVSNYKDINVSKEINNKVIFINPPEDNNDLYYELVNEELLNISLDKYYGDNSDTVGYIKVFDTPIDYPIVQTINNTYYLKHSFDKKSNKAGWVFSDFRNNLDNLNYNSIIYGHKRKDGTMFGSLDKLLNEDYFKENKHHTINLQTFNYSYLFQIFSVYTIQEENYYLKPYFINKEEYALFLETIINRSKIKFPATVTIDDKILTLSTCLDNNGNRIVIHAKLIKKGIL